MSAKDQSAVLAALLARRTVRPRRLTSPGPSGTALEQIIAAGYHGIDHGKLRPWRLLLIEDRELLADAFEAAERESTADTNPSALAKARERALAGPVVLTLVVRLVPNHPEAPEHEQWMAVGAAVQQMLLAAEALGFAGSMLSGRKTRSQALRTAFDLDEQERLVGFLAFGTAAVPPPPRPASLDRPALTRWP